MQFNCRKSLSVSLKKTLFCLSHRNTKTNDNMGHNSNTRTDIYHHTFTHTLSFTQQIFDSTVLLHTYKTLNREFASSFTQIQLKKVKQCILHTQFETHYGITSIHSFSFHSRSHSLTHAHSA